MRATKSFGLHCAEIRCLAGPKCYLAHVEKPAYHKIDIREKDK